MAQRAPAGLDRALGLAVALGLLSCASPGPEHTADACGPPRFPYADGWLGADAAYSIPISAHKSVWLFGDTFVGTPEQQGRRGASLVHNSIAISECRSNGQWAIEYRWARDEDGAPRSFLDAEQDESYWWLFDGFVYGDRLYIGLLEVVSTPPRGPLNLPFRFRGMKLARIANHRDDPNDWRFEVLPLSSSSRAIPGSAMVVHGEHLYLFAFLDLDARHYPRMLARVPLAAFEASPARPRDHLEYLSRDGRWKPGLDSEDAQLLMKDDATEMTVRYHPSVRRWIALYSHPNLLNPFSRAASSSAVTMRTADRLEGPWSDPQPIYRVPELEEGSASNDDPSTVCYAAKEHPQYARRGQLLFTYVCNLLARDGEDPLAVLRRLEERMDLYRPTAVSIPLPAAAFD